MIYVTSFNKRLYKATGYKMLKSFAEKNPDTIIQSFIEDISDNELFDILNNHHNLLVSPLDQLSITEWEKNNTDIIPTEFGGTFVCECRFDKKNPSSGHIEGCPAGGMRRRAVHWFRKILTWKTVSDFYKDEKVVWVDCDTILKKNLPDRIIHSLLDQYPIRFHLGKRRSIVDSGIETGVVLFDFSIGSGVKNIVDFIWDSMMDGSFLKEKRWDDAWMLTVACRKFKCIQKGDLHPKCMTTRPMDSGPLSDYIYHDKGVHWKKHNIYKGEK